MSVYAHRGADDQELVFRLAKELFHDAAVLVIKETLVELLHVHLALGEQRADDAVLDEVHAFLQFSHGAWILPREASSGTARAFASTLAPQEVAIKIDIPSKGK